MVHVVEHLGFELLHGFQQLLLYYVDLLIVGRCTDKSLLVVEALCEPYFLAFFNQGSDLVSLGELLDDVVGIRAIQVIPFVELFEIVEVLLGVPAKEHLGRVFWVVLDVEDELEPEDIVQDILTSEGSLQLMLEVQQVDDVVQFFVFGDSQRRFLLVCMRVVVLQQLEFEVESLESFGVLANWQQSHLIHRLRAEFVN